MPIFFDAHVVARRDDGWEDMLERTLLHWTLIVVEERRIVLEEHYYQVSSRCRHMSICACRVLTDFLSIFCFCLPPVFFFCFFVSWIPQKDIPVFRSEWWAE